MRCAVCGAWLVELSLDGQWWVGLGVDGLGCAGLGCVVIDGVIIIG